MVDTQTLILGTVAFFLHFMGKWKETPLPFLEWVKTKDNIIYWITSTLLCALAMLMADEWAGVAGMTKNTWVAVTCYGGGHVVSRLLNIQSAAVERRGRKQADQ